MQIAGRSEFLAQNFVVLCITLRLRKHPKKIFAFSDVFPFKMKNNGECSRAVHKIAAQIGLEEVVTVSRKLNRSPQMTPKLGIKPGLLFGRARIMRCKSGKKRHLLAAFSYDGLFDFINGHTSTFRERQIALLPMGHLEK